MRRRRRQVRQRKAVSNEMLAGLLVIAISLVSITTLQMVGVTSEITGWAQTTGVSNVTIYSDTTITAVNGTIELGTGIVNATKSWAHLYSNGTLPTNWNESVQTTSLDIRNDGNNALNITITSAKNVSEFACTGDTSCATANASYGFFVPDAGGNCTNETGVTVKNFTEAAQVFCQLLGPTKSSSLFILLQIPNNAAGLKTDTVTFDSAVG